MAVLTIRSKNQVTVPQAYLAQAHLRPGDPIEFTALPDGGIGLYPFGAKFRRRTLWEAAADWAEAAPGVEDIELELPPRGLAEREVVW